MFILTGTMVKVLVGIIENGTIVEGGDYDHPLAIYDMVMKKLITNINGLGGSMVFALSCTAGIQDKHLVLIKNGLVVAVSQKSLTKKQLTIVSEK